jgi:peptidoglycan hydrolase-like protein with peptidoglycan-binding domain
LDGGLPFEALRRRLPDGASAGEDTGGHHNRSVREVSRMDSAGSFGVGESLGPGDEGEHVAALQWQLQQMGYYQGELDGQYAEVTETAVRDLQRAYGHSDDGRAGSAVWELFGDGSQAAVGQVEQEAQHAYGTDGGQWQWDGTQWQAAGSGAQDPAAEPAPVADVGAMSEDGQVAVGRHAVAVGQPGRRFGRSGVGVLGAGPERLAGPGPPVRAVRPVVCRAEDPGER